MEPNHEGHRQRLKQRFLAEGLSHFSDRDLLELLLFYAVPRKDTAPIAQDLLDRFGSFFRVLEATPEELYAVAGMSENSAILFSMLPQILRRYWKDTSIPGKVLSTTAQCGNYLVPLYFMERDEVVYLLCLDAKCKVLGCPMVHRGSVNTASVSVRKIVETALRFNATTAVLSHNHPSGIALPSPEDIATTEQVRQALELVDIKLTDHIIVAEDDFVSMRESNYI